MRSTSRLVWGRIFLVVVVAQAGWVSLCTTCAEAQTGKNAVYDSSQNCCQKSPAFIDASVFASSTYPDICTLLNHVLAWLAHLCGFGKGGD